MINFVAHSRIVDPGVDFFYLGDFAGAVYDKVKLWYHGCPAPTEETAEYDFPSAQGDYTAFLHTDDTKPTLLNYHPTGMLDCINDDIYGVVSLSGGDVLVVNAVRNPTGFHLADIIYQGVVDFLPLWTSFTADPITQLAEHDVRIDANGHNSILTTNPYYVSEVTVASDLSASVIHNELKVLYSAGAESVSFDYRIDGPTLSFVLGGVLLCNYEPGVTPSLTFQYGDAPTGPWTDIAPDSQTWKPSTSAAGTLGRIEGYILMASLPVPYTGYLYLRMKVTYAAKTFYSAVARTHRPYGNYSIGSAGSQYNPVLNGTMVNVQKLHFLPDTGKMIVKETVSTWVANVYDIVGRLVERDWADFWSEPTVIVTSESNGSLAANNAFIPFASRNFSDGSVGIAYFDGYLPALWLRTEGMWEKVVLPAIPEGYEWNDEPLFLVDLDHPCIVTTITQNDPWGTRLIIYDITLGTWSVQGGNLASGYAIAFNSEGDKLFFMSADDGLWHCTSLVPSNSIFFQEG